MSELECKGDWILGTACRRCARCARTAAPTIDALKELKNKAETKLLRITAAMPRAFDGIDITDEFKVQCFNAARKAAYSE